MRLWEIRINTQNMKLETGKTKLNKLSWRRTSAKKWESLGYSRTLIHWPDRIFGFTFSFCSLFYFLLQTAELRNVAESYPSQTTVFWVNLYHTGKHGSCLCVARNVQSRW